MVGGSWDALSKTVILRHMMWPSKNSSNSHVQSGFDQLFYLYNPPLPPLFCKISVNTCVTQAKFTAPNSPLMLSSSLRVFIYRKGNLRRPRSRRRKSWPRGGDQREAVGKSQRGSFWKRGQSSGLLLRSDALRGAKL